MVDTNMSKKPKKVKKNKVKELDHDTAFNIGWDSEQIMAESICDQTSGNSEEGHDTAFIAAFQGLTVRMLRFWDPEFLHELIEDAVENSDEEPYVCSDCMEKDGPVVTVSNEDKNKMH